MEPVNLHKKQNAKYGKTKQFCIANKCLKKNEQTIDKKCKRTQKSNKNLRAKINRQSSTVLFSVNILLF